MYQDLHFYIDLNWEYLVDNQDKYFDNLHQLVEFAYQHKATVYYSKQQIAEFSTVEEDYITSKYNELDIILENALPKNTKQYTFEICFSGENTSLNWCNNLAIDSMIAYSKIALLSLCESYGEKALLSIKSKTDFEKINFDVLTNINEIQQWIKEKGNPRIFHKSDKHGESGKGKKSNKWEEVSALLCNEKEAQNLLNTSIPDFNEIDKRLFNFDSTNETFIEFFYENAQNQWHGFHIKKEDWNKRVPEKVRKYFGKF